jgi:hypothetical protein
MKLILKIIFFPFIIIWKILSNPATASALKNVEKGLNIKM